VAPPSGPCILKTKSTTWNPIGEEVSWNFQYEEGKNCMRVNMVTREPKLKTIRGEKTFISNFEGYEAINTMDQSVLMYSEAENTLLTWDNIENPGIPDKQSTGPFQNWTDYGLIALVRYDNMEKFSKPKFQTFQIERKYAFYTDMTKTKNLANIVINAEGKSFANGQQTGATAAETVTEWRTVVEKIKYTLHVDGKEVPLAIEGDGNSNVAHVWKCSLFTITWYLVFKDHKESITIEQGANDPALAAFIGHQLLLSNPWRTVGQCGDILGSLHRYYDIGWKEEETK